jgi:D-alanine-D-alanine ligase-like ATP-grasp enzyme
MNTSKRYQGYNFFASDDIPGINSLDLNRIHELIKKIRNEDPCSFIIMFLHWQGIDYKHASENKKIRTACSKLIEYGANYIFGHGPHILDGFEKRESGTIAYSIGNFIFNSKGRYQNLEVPPYSAIAKLQFEENEYDWNIESRFYPIVTDNLITNYQSRVINEIDCGNLTKALSEKNAIDLEKDSFGYYFSTNIENSEPSLLFQDQKTSDSNFNNIILQKPNEYKNEIFSTSNLLETEFEKMGYSSTRIGKYLVVNLGKENVVFLETESSYTSLVGSRIVKDKTTTKKFLKIAGLNVMEGKGFLTKEKEKAYDFTMSLSAGVIKPVDGNKGRGVTVGVKNREEFENAWNIANSVTNSKILVEEQFIGGTEARYLVVGGRCVAVFSCIAPNIIGDGINTIEELIKQKNKIRLKNPHLKNRLIKMNQYRLSIINSQGYDLSSIPDKGVKVTLDWKSAVATGGDSIDITDETHILYKKLAEKAVNSIPGLDIAGVDIIAYNHFQEPQENHYTIVEINTRPGIGGHHYPLFGKSRNVAGIIANYCIKRALKERNESDDN